MVIAQHTKHPGILKAYEQHLDWHQLLEKLNYLSVAMSSNDILSIRTILQQTVNGYEPSSDVVDWVHMAQKVKSGRVV